jgi:lipoyl(octanoyl) transferase
MRPSSPDIEPQSPALEAFLLGQIAFDTALALQQRLVEQYRDRDDGQIALLLCEHPSIITIGRGGSPGDVAMQSGLVRNGQIDVRWVNRGGGSLVHCPGQLAIYPIVPLRWHGFTVGQFLDRLSIGISESLGDLNVPCSSKKAGAAPGIWGRSGQLAAIGVSVRHWVTYYGAYLNVCPPMGLFRLVRPDMSCLVAERRGPVRMTAVRAALVRRLAECFGCDRYHLYTGHPLLRRRA